MEKLAASSARRLAKRLLVAPVCLNRHARYRGIATLDTSKTTNPKPYYLTTPIFYVNACMPPLARDLSTSAAVCDTD